MRGNELLDNMDLVDPAYVEEADTHLPEGMSRKKGWIALVACAVMIFCMIVLGQMAVRSFIGSGKGGTLGKPQKVVISRVELEDIPVRSESLTESLTEEELFARWDTTIIRGYVLDTYNVEINFDGEKVYGAIVTLKVKKVFRGECTAGEKIKLFLDYPLDLSDDHTDIWTEDAEVISQVRVGMDGIFMMMPYGNNETWTKNDCTLSFRSLAGYHLPDGVRFAFLETDDGLIFHEETFESIAGATTLTEVEEYVRGMVR